MTDDNFAVCDPTDPSLDRLNAHLAARRSTDEADGLHDHIDDQLLPVFLEEADELCPMIGLCLRDEPGHDTRLLNRLLHTLKGSARMTGAMRIGNVAHEMEGRLLADATGLRDEMEGDFAQINGLLEELRRYFPQNPARPVMPMTNRMSERLYRAVRQTARELGKHVSLDLIGFDTAPQAPAKMAVPLEHLLCNAIAHGIEDEPHRIKSGKEPIGEITLRLHRENDELVFELADDGCGLDLAALRAEAIKKGLLADTQLSEDQLAQLIFVPGLSTASELTQVSGRGIGMDVVYSEITALGGRIDVRSRQGQGTQFTIRLPVPYDTES